MKNASEQVCSIRRTDLETVFLGGLQQGGFTGPTLEEVLLLPQKWPPRLTAEEDFLYKQLIPYQVFSSRGKIFVYIRGGGVGEKRLAGRLSIGVGGHINSNDAVAGLLVIEQYYRALFREREEELDCSEDLVPRFIGWINDDSDPVGQVHLGAVHLCEVSAVSAIAIKEGGEDIRGDGWWTIDEIMTAKEQFEKWSILALSLVQSRVYR